MCKSAGEFFKVDFIGPDSRKLFPNRRDTWLTMGRHPEYKKHNYIVCNARRHTMSKTPKQPPAPKPPAPKPVPTRKGIPGVHEGDDGRGDPGGRPSPSKK